MKKGVIGYVGFIKKKSRYDFFMKLINKLIKEEFFSGYTFGNNTYGLQVDSKCSFSIELTFIAKKKIIVK